MRCWMSAYVFMRASLFGLQPRLLDHRIKLRVVQMVHAPELSLGGRGVLGGDHVGIGADGRDVDGDAVCRRFRLGSAADQRRPGLRPTFTLMFSGCSNSSSASPIRRSASSPAT